MINVIDYGVSNVGSIINMLKKINVKTQVVKEGNHLKNANKIILPGVGAFDFGVSELQKRGIDEIIKKKVIQDKVPLLGICLGMQLLGESSEEGTKKGLGLIKGKCVKFNFENSNSLKVPHMGWNNLSNYKEDFLLKNINEKSRFYFVHSYHFKCINHENVVGKTNYGFDFNSIIRSNNVWGVQFHPEKSHKFGMQLLRNFSII